MFCKKKWSGPYRNFGDSKYNKLEKKTTARSTGAKVLYMDIL